MYHPPRRSIPNHRNALPIDLLNETQIIAITSLFDADNIKPNQIRLPVNDVTNLWKESLLRAIGRMWLYWMTFELMIV